MTTVAWLTSNASVVTPSPLPAVIAGAVDAVRETATATATATARMVAERGRWNPPSRAPRRPRRRVACTHHVPSPPAKRSIHFIASSTACDRVVRAGADDNLLDHAVLPITTVCGMPLTPNCWATLPLVSKSTGIPSLVCSTTLGERPAHKVTQVAGNAFIGVKAEHPFKAQLLPRTLQEELPMPMLCRSTRLDVGFPRPIGQDQGDLGVTAEQLQRPVRARVIIGDDRIDVSADKLQRITHDQSLVANAGDSDQAMCLSQEPCVARNDPLRVAELPRGCAAIDHRVP